jgi:hypothetical protein
LYLSVGYFVLFTTSPTAKECDLTKLIVVVRGWSLKPGKAKSARDLEHKSFFFSFRQGKVITDLQEFEENMSK